MIAFPFKFTHCKNADVVYTAKSMDEFGNVLITWIDDVSDDEEATSYSSAGVNNFLRNGTWLLLEPKIDLRSALKIKLFEMRIEEMEKNLTTLKREFEMHKQDVKGTH